MPGAKLTKRDDAYDHDYDDSDDELDNDDSEVCNKDC